MLQYITDHAGTVIVSLMVAGLVTGIIVRLYRDRKQGKCSCGGNCGCCPMGGSCHKARQYPKSGY